MKLPARIAVPDSRDAITKEVKRLLRAADAYGRIPTPREDILNCAELVESGDLNLSDYEESFTRKAFGFLHKAVEKVLGFLDYRIDLVYVDPKIHPNKRNFVTYHEVSHKILEWQRVIYTEDDTGTLSPECHNIFEAEANFGAAELLFQCERFEELARDYNISVASTLELANRFEASAHATMRRFVERNLRPCMVLVLKPTSFEHESGLKSYVVCYSVASKPFWTKFGDPFSARFINPGNRLCEIVNTGFSGQILINDLNGKQHECNVDLFDNGHHTFALIFPPIKSPARIVVEFR